MKKRHRKAPSIETLKAEVDALLCEHSQDRVRLRKQIRRIYKYAPELLLYYAFGEPVDSDEMQVEKTTIASLPEEYTDGFALMSDCFRERPGSPGAAGSDLAASVNFQGGVTMSDLILKNMAWGTV